MTSPSPVPRHALSDQPQMAETPQHAQLNLERKRIFSSPLAKDSPSQLQRVLQAARGALHRDMSAASSPASSIESRMNLEQTSSWQPEGSVRADIREWRYSTAPQTLATTSVDVREPLPSPTLPELSVGIDYVPDKVTEPVSSGFVSPSTDCQVQDVTDSAITGSPTEDVSVDASCSVHAPDSSIDTGLDQDLQRLQVDSDEPDVAGSEESPTVRYLKSRSCRGSVDFSVPVSPVNSIYLSESAQAAAESAKAKRRWLRGIFPGDGDTEPDFEERDEVMVDQLPEFAVICPDPQIHHIIASSPCPEPSLHSQSPSLYRRPMEIYGPDVMSSDWTNRQTMPMGPSSATHRATATGSPMPFTKFRSRPSTAYSDRQSLRMSPMLRRREAELATVNEHFQPGWYYAKEPVRSPPGQTYSFSTAASKAIGSDQAPDSRMRDSYKTDTLTALPVPTSRYRKNGIGAEIHPRGVSRYYERPPSSARTCTSRPRPSSRQTYASGSEVRFRSSPPRASGQDQFPPMRRKRAMDDSYIVAEDMYRPVCAEPDIRLRARNNAMQMDEDTRTAVRTSIFGASTPEALRRARQGIRELSPNVQVYRRGVQENQHQRKKRRPSYWDNDLKEVRESPAGRGGVRSPVSTQESLRAEVEVASQRDVEMILDEDDVAGEDTRLSMVGR